VPEGSEFATRVYAAVNARDREALRALSAPDIVVGTTVEAYTGPEALLEWLDEGDDAFDDFTVELLEVEELAGRVVASMRQRGRGKASGAEVDDGITHVWTLRDGRAIGLRSFARRDEAVRHVQLQVVEALIDAWNRRDLDAALKLMHPQCEGRAIESTEPAHGHAGVAAAFRSWFEAFEEFAIEAEDFSSQGDRVLVAMRQRARGRGSGVEVEERLHQLFTLRDGKVIRFEEYSDEADALKAFARPTGF
jgi:ketosteroid isomerase-like protein